MADANAEEEELAATELTTPDALEEPLAKELEALAMSL